MTKPIRPSQMRKSVTKPDGVIEVFNELILKDWDGSRAVVRQEEAARLIAERMEVPVKEVYDKRWLDVEEVYRAAGWRVEYDRPGFNESYPPTFTFSVASPGRR